MYKIGAEKSSRCMICVRSTCVLNLWKPWSWSSCPFPIARSWISHCQGCCLIALKAPARRPIAFEFLSASARPARKLRIRNFGGLALKDLLVGFFRLGGAVSLLLQRLSQRLGWWVLGMRVGADLGPPCGPLWTGPGCCL